MQKLHGRTWIDNLIGLASTIGAAEIADDAIDSRHVAAGALDTEHYAASSVGVTAIKDDAIDSRHLAAGAVDVEHTENQLKYKTFGYAQDNAITTGATSIYLWIAPVACTLVNVELLACSTINGSTANHWKFQVDNKTDGTTLLSTTAFDAAETRNATDITADTRYQLNPDMNLGLAAGDVLELNLSVSGAPSPWRRPFVQGVYY